MLTRIASTGKPKIVHLLTTSHRPAQANTTKRDRDGNIIQKPTCIIDYNYNMGGVDTMDQQLDAIDVEEIIQVVQEALSQANNAVLY